MKLEEAEVIAARVVEALTPHAERIEIAGSIRRKRPDVNDIDIVMLPKQEFGIGNAITSKCQFLARETKLDLNGPKIKRFWVGGPGAWGDFAEPISIDLYLALEAKTFPTLFLVRTGSMEHNVKLTTIAMWQDKKLEASGRGLSERASGKLIAWESEEAIFEALKLAYLPPEQRDLPIQPCKRPAVHAKHVRTLEVGPGPRPTLIWVTCPGIGEADLASLAPPLDSSIEPRDTYATRK